MATTTVRTSTTFTEVYERTTHVYRATLKDEDDAVVPASALSSLTLTLYADRPEDIINSRSQQDVLNTNNVTLSSLGALVWIMQPADNAIVKTSRAYEMHVALFEWTYASGTKYGKHEVRFNVRNLKKVS